MKVARSSENSIIEVKESNIKTNKVKWLIIPSYAVINRLRRRWTRLT